MSWHKLYSHVTGTLRAIYQDGQAVVSLTDSDEWQAFATLFFRTPAEAKRYAAAINAAADVVVESLEAAE